MAIKAIIFDFWGTLADQGVHPSPIRQVKAILRLRIPFQEYIIPFEKTFMTKSYEDLTQAFTAVCKIFAREPKQWLVEKLVGLWNKNRLLAKLYPETISVLEELKNKGYKLALISNTDFSSVESLLDRFDLRKYFDVIHLSFKTGFLKTDKESFETVLKELGVGKEQVLMVGDSLATDIEGAKNVGIKAVLVDRKDKREYENKIKSLEELKNILEEEE